MKKKEPLNKILIIKGKNLKKYISKSHINVQQAINNLNNTNELFQIVLNDKNILLGTLTDGDLRRAMLNGIQLSDNVIKSINKTPIIGSLKKDKSNFVKLNKVRRIPSFIPILNDKKILKSIIIKNEEISIKDALIMAGGLGSRLGKITRNKPKALLKIGKSTMIDICIERLQDADIKKIYISVNYLGKKIIDHLNKKKFKAEIIPFFEKSKLGTIGSLSIIKNKINFPILVINVDLITSLSIKNFINYHKFEGQNGTIAASIHKITVPYGVLRYNSLGQLIKVDEKPNIKNLVSAGIYIFDKNIINLLKRDKPMDAPVLISKAIEKGFKISVFPIHEKWTDVGNHADLKNEIIIAKMIKNKFSE